MAKLTRHTSKIFSQTLVTSLTRKRSSRPGLRCLWKVVRSTSRSSSCTSSVARRKPKPPSPQPPPKHHKSRDCQSHSWCHHHLPVWTHAEPATVRTWDLISFSHPPSSIVQSQHHLQH